MLQELRKNTTMQKLNCYFYPYSARLRQKEVNPYTQMLMDVLESDFTILNKTRPSDKGIFDLMAYIKKTHFIFVNWIEELPDKKLGWIQSVVWMILVKLRKALGFKVVWVMHNKQSHDPGNRWLKGILYRFMVRNSDLIFTHSTEGVRHANRICSRSGGPKVFFHHPVLRRHKETAGRHTAYDMVIWGKMAPYKGIIEFLEYLNKRPDLQGRYKILIAGKFTSDDYFNEVNQLAYPNLTLINSFIDDNRLSDLILQSKIVLFTYNQESVLSSGALMTSLEFPAMILGPHSAAFADAANEGIIETYQDFDELFSKADQMLSDPMYLESVMHKQDAFARENSWTETGRLINQHIRELFSQKNQ